MSEWKPIETAPKDGTRILVLTMYGDIECADWYVFTTPRYEGVKDDLYRRVEDKTSEGWNCSSSPTHWMPLPEPPK